MSGRRRWPAGADTGRAQRLYSPSGRAISARQARRPLQTSKPMPGEPVKEGTCR
ncbi:hypothetical protein AB0K60_07180 [Thermopolyspora sp. NPDC052614]|uniref:hypothetical protein n=1 Tax=Thermopolyspora sp. NPDC052614 TaxID=3155682 RepID=UPI003432FA4D